MRVFFNIFTHFIRLAVAGFSFTCPALDKVWLPNCWRGVYTLHWLVSRVVFFSFVGGHERHFIRCSLLSTFVKLIFFFFFLLFWVDETVFMMGYICLALIVKAWKLYLSFGFSEGTLLHFNPWKLNPSVVGLSVWYSFKFKMHSLLMWSWDFFFFLLWKDSQRFLTCEQIGCISLWIL